MNQNVPRIDEPPVILIRLEGNLIQHEDSEIELLTQELMGYPVRIRSTRGDFTRCILRDGYTGWMPSSCLAASGSYPATHFVKTRFAWIRGRETGPILAPMGSRLKVVSPGKPVSAPVSPGKPVSAPGKPVSAPVPVGIEPEGPGIDPEGPGIDPRGSNGGLSKPPGCSYGDGP